MNTEDYSDKPSDKDLSLKPDLSRIETIKLLTESIDKLEKIVEHLKVTSTTDNLPPTSVTYVVELTETLANTVNNLAQIEPQKISSPLVKPTFIKQPKRKNNWLQAIRSNLLVTGIVATLIVALISTSVFWFSDRSTETKLAVNPEKNPTTFEELEKPTQPIYNNSSKIEEPATAILPEVTIPSQPIQVTPTSPDSDQTKKPATVILPEVTIPSQTIQVTPTSPEIATLPKPTQPSTQQISEPKEQIPSEIVTAPETRIATKEPSVEPEQQIPSEIVTAPEIPIATKEPSVEPDRKIPPEIVTLPEPKQPKPEAQIPSEIVTVPEVSIATEPAKNLIKPTPLPLTPEQNLVVALQTKLAEITSQNFDDVVLSIQANFFQNDVLVKLSDRWYRLNQSEQDKLANEIFQKAQKLDFQKLEITDNNGTLIARNPIVGQQIIILQRTKDNV